MKLHRMFGGVMAAVVALTLAACGSGSSNSSSSSTPANPTLSSKRVKSGTLTAYVAKGKNTDWLKASLKLYNKKYGTDLKLNPTDVAPAVPMVQKITPMLVAKQSMPDLVFLQDSNAGAVMSKFSKDFYSSQDYGFVKKYGDDFYTAKMNYAKSIAPDKKVYGFPNDWGTTVLFYNDVLFKKAGINFADVKTWDQMIDAGKTLKEKTGKNLMFMRDTGDLDTVKNIAMQLGAPLIDKNGAVDISNPKVIKAYSILKKIQDANIVSYGNMADYLKIGQQTGIIQAGGWFASMQQESYPNEKGDWRVRALPLVNASDKVIQPANGGSSYYVPKKSKNGLAAMQFLTFMLTDKGSLDAYIKLAGLPANTTAYKSAAANEGFAYYGGQKLTQEMNKITLDSLTVYSYPYVSDLDTYLAAASYDVKKNGTAPKAALDKQAQLFADKYSIKVVK